MKAMYYVSILVAAMALLTLSVPVPAYSRMMNRHMQDYRQGCGQMMGMCTMDKPGDMMGMCIAHAEKIGLTDDQIMKMKPIHRAMQKKQAQFEADLKIAGIDLGEIMDVKDFDLEKASAAVRKISDLKTTHRLDMLKGMKEMRTLLTDEQFKKMKMMMPMNMGEHKRAKKMIKK